MDYETSNKIIKVSPRLVDATKPESGLAFIRIFSPSSAININKDLIKEVREILEVIEERYIDN